MIGATVILVCWPLVCYGLYRLLAREAARASRQDRRCPRCGEPFSPERAKCPMCGWNAADSASKRPRESLR